MYLIYENRIRNNGELPMNSEEAYREIVNTSKKDNTW